MAVAWHAAPAQHVHALYTRCEEYRKQALALTDKLQQEKFERKQMKVDLEDGFKEQLDTLRNSRTYTLCCRSTRSHPEMVGRYVTCDLEL